MLQQISNVPLSSCPSTGGNLHDFTQVHMRASRLVLVLKDAFAPFEDVAPALLPRLPLARRDPWLPAAYRLP